MEILWPAIGIAVIVGFVFYVLAQHWQQVLRRQARTIRHLAKRVQDLEDMSDPELRRRLSEASPLPLEQVFTLSVRLSEEFWRNALHTTEDDRAFIRENGSFLGSVKLERWRSHTVASITEILPERKGGTRPGATGWQTRSLDLYPERAKNGEAFPLWELALSRPAPSAERPPWLELVLRGEVIELRGHLASRPRCGAGDNHAQPPRDYEVFFHVPLDPTELAEFRSPNPLATDEASATSGGESAANDPASEGNFWEAVYSDRNDALGIEWQLRLRDLSKKAEWERWKILESRGVPSSN